jgi:putative FmdB family regulatory protein
MATYNYHCTKCNKKFSISIPMSCKPPDDQLFCPNCHIAGTAKRIWDKLSFQLKSKGFFKTDYGETPNE